MEGGDLELGELLAAAEAAPPSESVDVVARDLQKRLGAQRVSFLFVDLIGQRLVRLAAADDEVPDPAEPIDLQGSVYDSVLRSQRQHVEPEGQDGRRVITPVTNRGDCIGVLEVTLQSVDDTVLQQVRDAAHTLAYIIVTDGRFTDLYHLGRRTTETSLAAEIQHQLLPRPPAARRPSSPSPPGWSPPTTSVATPTTTASTATPCTCPSPTRWATTRTPHCWPPCWSARCGGAPQWL